MLRSIHPIEVVGIIAKKIQARSLPTTSDLETEWDYSGRKGRDGQKKKISKAKKERKK